MQETIINYLTGLPEDASKSERKLHKKYGEIASVRTKRFLCIFNIGQKRSIIL